MSNLSYLFANTTYAPPKQIILAGGKLTVYMRPQSAQYQCRFKLANNKWHCASTGTTDIEQAKIQAVAIYETVKIKTDAGLAISTKTFKQIALDEIANMSSALANNTGRRCYRDYIFATTKYLIPFFGKYEVEKITTEMLADFDAWRISEMGKVPVASTKRNHASAYIRVVNLAREHGYVGHNRSVPLLDAKGKRSQPRPVLQMKK
jgi:hypothetical protein